MKIIFGVFRFYINASIHVAIAVCSLVGITMLEFNLKIPILLWYFVFFGTITGYNFVKYAEIAGMKHKTLKDSLKSIQLFSLFAFCGMIFFGLQLPVETLLAIGIFAVFTFLYAVPFLKYRNLRALGGLKIFIVALVWAGVTVIVPTIAAKTSLDADCWLTFAQRFLIVVVLTLPFEIRDLKYDSSSLQTLPQILGLKNAKLLGTILLLVAILLDGFKDEFAYNYFASLILVCAIIMILLMASEIKQSKYFAAFWVEGVPVLWIVLLLWLSQLF